MIKLKFYKKVPIEFKLDPRLLDCYDDSMTGESIAYILGGRDHWKRIVFALSDPALNADTAEHFIKVLTNALDDTLHFQEIFSK